MTIRNPLKVIFTAIASADFVIPQSGGSTNWIDTDVSATTGVDTSKIWVIVITTGGDFSGARPHGSAINNAGWSNHTTYARVDSYGHMDLLEGAAGNITYRFVGYLSCG